MKEILNLIENYCFGETDYSNPSQEANDKTLQILMFMILKRNELLKTRGCTNGSVQRINTSKEELSSLTSDYYAFKIMCCDCKGGT